MRCAKKAIHNMLQNDLEDGNITQERYNTYTARLKKAEPGKSILWYINFINQKEESR